MVSYAGWVPIARPLSGEPLALDLVDTEWIDEGRHHDLLASRSGHAQWLAERGLSGPTTPVARQALVEARTAIRGALEQPDDPRAAAALDRVLAHGRIRLRAGESGYREEIEVVPERRAAWLAARDLVSLEPHGPRVRNCNNPDCILWFLDTTRSGTRRWCSMAVCGNRLKARRHYERRQTERADRLDVR